MNTKWRQWLPMALCCLPGILAAALIGVGAVALGGASLSGPLGLGLIALAVLACPLSMGLMMWRSTRHHSATDSAPPMANCCLPGETLEAFESNAPAERLAALRARREALERELAELQTR